MTKRIIIRIDVVYQKLWTFNEYGNFESFRRLNNVNYPHSTTEIDIVYCEMCVPVHTVHTYFFSAQSVLLHAGTAIPVVIYIV